jgi:hypothetical protein
LDAGIGIRKIVFPKEIFYDAKKHEYSTTESMGTLLRTNEYALNENRNSQIFLENSYSVVPTGKLTNQIVEDFLKFSELPDCHLGGEE